MPLNFCFVIRTMNIFIPNHKVFVEIKRENIFIYQNSVLYRALMVSYLCCSDDTADGKRDAGALLRSISRWTKPDGKGSLKQIFHSLYLPTLLHTSWKKQLFLIPVFSLSWEPIWYQWKEKQNKTKKPTNSLKTESAPERPAFAGAFPKD